MCLVQRGATRCTGQGMARHVGRVLALKPAVMAEWPNAMGPDGPSRLAGPRGARGLGARLRGYSGRYRDVVVGSGRTLVFLTGRTPAHAAQSRSSALAAGRQCGRAERRAGARADPSQRHDPSVAGAPRRPGRPGRPRPRRRPDAAQEALGRSLRRHREYKAAAWSMTTLWWAACRLHGTASLGALRACAKLQLLGTQSHLEVKWSARAACRSAGRILAEKPLP